MKRDGNFKQNFLSYTLAYSWSIAISICSIGEMANEVVLNYFSGFRISK